MKTDRRILLTPTLFRAFGGKHQDLLAASDLEPIYVDHDIGSETELITVVTEHKPLVAIASDEKWTRGALEAAAANGMKFLSRHGTGVASVDLVAAKELGIGVANTPGTTKIPVSEDMVWMIGNALRHISQSNTTLHSGKWVRIAGKELFGMSVLLVGAGNIAREAAYRLAALGAKVTMASRNKNADVAAFIEECGVMAAASKRFGSVDWLQCGAKDLKPHLHKFNIVVAICPQTPETEGFIDHAFLASLRPDAILGNMSRGALVADESHALQALEAGAFLHYFTDVFRTEPIVSLADCPFLGHPAKITVSSHEGWLTEQNIGRQVGGAVENLLCALAGRPLPEGRVWVVPPPSV